jgi:hypothetical protein
MPFVAQVADERDHHQTVEHRHAGQRDEADRRRDRQRNAAQPQRHDAAGQRERNAGEHQQPVLHVVEHHEQQHEHHEQRQRHDDLQALAPLCNCSNCPPHDIQ